MLAIAYIVAGIFVSIFDAAANTILQCYLIDVDISKQLKVDEAHVPQGLKRFLESMAVSNDRSKQD